MKKIILISFAAIAAFISCQKEVPINEENTGDPLVFTANIATDGTKTTLSDDAKAAKIYWESDDKITITDASSNTAIYKLASGAGTITGTFVKDSGDNLDNSGTYTATYGTPPSTDQTYSASGSVPLYMTAHTTSSAKVFLFKVQCGVLRLTLTDATHKIMKVEVSDGTSTYELNSSDGVDITSATNFYLALPAGTYTSLKIYNNDIRMFSRTGISLGVTAGHVKPVIASSLSFTPTTKGFKGSRAIVQLWAGGPYWATTNIGASSETDYGPYFAWGYPEGCVSKADNSGLVLASDNTTEKTFTSDATGYPDYASHVFSDMATANLGIGWKVPTDTDFANLLSTTYTTIEYITSGTSGIRVRGKGDYSENSIFLPASGLGSVSKIVYYGTDGFYWSRVPHPSNAEIAYYLRIIPKDEISAVWGTYKYFGAQIRPVLYNSTTGMPVDDPYNF